MNGEQHDMLIRVDENMKAVLIRLNKLPCREMSQEVATQKERLDTHHKFIIGTILTSIGSFLGILSMAVKGLIATGKTP